MKLPQALAELGLIDESEFVMQPRRAGHGPTGEHRAALTGQQFQSADNEPYYFLFEDFTHVKFYHRSLYDTCVLEGLTFDGFVHVEDWVPQPS